MKTYIKYIAMVAFALFSLNIVEAQEYNETEPAFFHDITYYTVEYQKSKLVHQTLETRNIHLAYLGLNRQFDMDQVNMPHKFTLASILKIFKKNSVKSETVTEQNSETMSLEKNPDDAIYYNDVIHN